MRLSAISLAINRPGGNAGVSSYLAGALQQFHTRASPAWAVVPNLAHNLLPSSGPMSGNGWASNLNTGITMQGERGTLTKRLATGTSQVYGVTSPFGSVVPLVPIEVSVEAAPAAGEENVMTIACDVSGVTTFTLTGAGSYVDGGWNGGAVSTIRQTAYGTYICSVRYTPPSNSTASVRFGVRVNGNAAIPAGWGLFIGHAQMRQVPYNAPGYTETFASPVPLYSLQTYAANVLRVLPSPAGVMAALREPQSTNYMQNSGQAAWAGYFDSGSSLTSAGVVDGLQCHLFTPATLGTTPSVMGTTDKNRLFVDFTAIGSGLHTNSVWVKAANNTAGQVLITVENSVTDTVVSGGSTTIAIPGVWTRISATGTTIDNGTNNGLRWLISSTQPIYVAYPQVEKLPFATQPIPTSGAAVTRSRDDINVTSATLGAGAPMAQFMDLLIPHTLSAQQNRLTGGSTVSAAITATGALELWNGTNVLDTATVTAANARAKVAWTGDGTGRAQSMNGGAVVSDANLHGAAASTILGSQNVGADSQAPCLYIHEFRHYKMRLSNSELQRITA